MAYLICGLLGKTFETKKRILDILGRRKMTITGLSRELKLSKATVSQHIEELRLAGAVEKVDTEYFKKLKFYKTNPGYQISMPAKTIGVIVIICVFAAALYVTEISQHIVIIPSNSASMNNTVTSPVAQPNAFVVTPGPLSPQAMCIIEFYGINGTLSALNGFSAYTLNSSAGSVYDYVIGRGTTGELELLENVSHVLPLPQGYNRTRSHYYWLRYNQSLGSFVTGVNITFNPARYYAENSTIRANVTVSVNESAPYGTYWITFDGPCGGGTKPALLTVGSAPYNGVIQSGPVTIYSGMR